MTGLELLFSLFLYAKQPNHISIQQPKATVSVQEVRDSRIDVLEVYLDSKGSPLAKSAETFIEVSDLYGLDWKLLPAIAGVESGFEKAGNTHDHNPFGYMCSNGPCSFESFEDAIHKVGHTIGTGRAYKGYRDSGQISVLANVYNYATPEDWAKKIIHFQNQIK